MKRIVMFFIMSLLVICWLNGQTVLYSENFDSYTAGQMFVQQSGGYPWMTWSNQPGGPEDVPVTNTLSRSNPNSLYFSNTQDDIILKLGNRTSGKYIIEFYYYIPAGKGAYFNVQHFEQPGIEWAIEVYFGNNGTGRTTVNNVNVNFGHVLNSWIKIETIVDLDNDTAWLKIDDSLVRTWKFSMQSNAATGTKQLGAINFYGGALPGQSPEFYLDDVSFIEYEAGQTPPIIVLSTTSIATDGTDNEIFTISNAGQQPLEFVAYPIFPSSSTLVYQQNNDEHAVLELKNNDMRNVELTYVNGGLTAGLGFQSSVTVRSAAKFDHNIVKPHIGRRLVSVVIGINEMPSGTTKVLVYDRGLYVTPGAGPLLAEKAFTPVAASEVTVTLDQPIYLDGKDIWIGWICDALASTYPIGLDAGPRVPGVNWLSVGPGWNELTQTIDNNLYIKGILQGSPIHQWVTVSPQSGTVQPGGSQPLTLSFNISGMPPGSYFAQISVGCNDQTNEFTEIDVNLTITNSVIENQYVHVIAYPNPSRDILHVQANAPIESIQLLAINGQIVHSATPHTLQYQIRTTELVNGYYILRILMSGETVEQKILIQ